MGIPNGDKWGAWIIWETSIFTDDLPMREFWGFCIVMLDYHRVMRDSFPIINVNQVN